MDWRTDDLTVGSFGGFSFLRRYGLTNFSMQSTLATEPQNQTGRKPSTIVDGPDLQSVQFDLRLSRALAVDPDAIIKELQSLLDAQSPRQLVMGGMVLGSYRWLLKSVSVTDAVHSADGGIVYCSVSLTFEEYVRRGVRETATSSTSSSSPGIVSNTTSKTTETHSSTPEEKKEGKRVIYNPIGIPIAGKIPDASDLKRGYENLKDGELFLKMKTGTASLSEGFRFFEKQDQSKSGGLLR